jgi:hypothetical protein
MPLRLQVYRPFGSYGPVDKPFLGLCSECLWCRGFRDLFAFYIEYFYFLQKIILL